MITGSLSSLLGAATKQPKVEFYQDVKLEWRWRLFYSSDQVAASSEGYKNKQDAKDNFLKIEEHIKWLRENGKIV